MVGHQFFLVTKTAPVWDDVQLLLRVCRSIRAIFDLTTSHTRGYERVVAFIAAPIDQTSLCRLLPNFLVTEIGFTRIEDAAV